MGEPGTPSAKHDGSWIPSLMPAHWTFVSESMSERSRRDGERKEAHADLAWYGAVALLSLLVTVGTPWVSALTGSRDPFLVPAPVLGRGSFDLLSEVDNSTSPEAFASRGELYGIRLRVPQMAMSLVAILCAVHMVSSWTLLSARQLQA